MPHACLLRCPAATNFLSFGYLAKFVVHWRVRDGETRSPTPETSALPRARAREFLSVFCVAHVPAQRGDSIAQLVASLPIFFVSRVFALLG
jgi:hypothetical protein